MDLRAKIGKDLRKKLDEKNPTPASSADIINWAEHVETVQPCSSVSEDPVLQEVPAVFASADVREDDISFRNRSKLSAKIKSSGQHERKREYSHRPSSNDLKLFLETSGFPKDMIKRTLTISANHISTRD